MRYADGPDWRNPGHPEEKALASKIQHCPRE
jgi:hypothetical protein